MHDLLTETEYYSRLGEYNVSNLFLLDCSDRAARDEEGIVGVVYGFCGIND